MRSSFSERPKIEVYVLFRYYLDFENIDNKIFVTWYFFGIRETIILAADWIDFYFPEFHDRM